MCLVYAIYMVPNSTELNNDMCAIYSLRRQKPNFCQCMTSLSHHMSHITIDYESHLWDLFLYPVETRGPVMVPGAVTPGVCIRGPSVPAFRIQLIAVCQFLDFTLQCA